jgi:hypothetical protein
MNQVFCEPPEEMSGLAERGSASGSLGNVWVTARSDSGHSARKQASTLARTLRDRGVLDLDLE